jgi:dTDP-4-amino-4,6-dideoxygalactose transaminase
VGVASGTDALRLALAAVGVSPGNEVITTPFTFIATANTISRCKATPVFVDIDPTTYNLDINLLEAAVTERTKAIVPVHLYGHSVEMDGVMAVARKHGLAVVEDCAQAIGARYRGRRVGSFGNAGCLSFFPSKNLGAYGDGGMVVTNDTGVADGVDLLRRHGSRKKYFAEVVGHNSRLDTLQAAILNVKLKYLDSWNESRRRAAVVYSQLLYGADVVSPSSAPHVEHVFHQYTIRAKRRDKLAEHLKKAGVETMIYYPTPLHLQPVYAHLGHKSGSFPESERACEEVLSLPIFPELTDSQIGRIAVEIRRFYSCA